MGRLNDGSADTFAAPDLRAWCDEQNHGRLADRMGRWYFVADVDGRGEAHCLEGADGQAARNLAKHGVEAEYKGWPESRMSGYRKWIASCVERGSVG